MRMGLLSSGSLAQCQRVLLGFGLVLASLPISLFILLLRQLVSVSAVSGTYLVLSRNPLFDTSCWKTF